MRHLIVNADDVGLCPEVDAGVLETVRAGAVTAASIFVNPPHRADVESFLDAGVSLCLHWNLNHGRPVSGAPSFADALEPDEAERELRAQLDLFHRLTGREPAQLNFHKHLHARDDRVLQIGIAVALERGIPLRAVNPAMRDLLRRRGVRTTDFFIGDTRPAPYWTVARMREILPAVAEGATELMCHPGRGVKPIAGLRYLAERDAEREALASAEGLSLLADFNLRGFDPEILK